LIVAVTTTLVHAEDREIAKRRAAERKTFTDAFGFGAAYYLGRADRNQSPLAPAANSCS
jgi:hypothetical protein